MTVMTAKRPLDAYDLDWLGRLSRREVSQAGLFVVGVTGWYAILPLFVAVAVGWLAALVSLPRMRFATNDFVLAVGAVGAWAILALLAEAPDNGATLGVETVASAAVVGALAALAFAAVGRSGSARAA